jgi:hypothetical protein
MEVAAGRSVCSEDQDPSRAERSDRTRPLAVPLYGRWTVDKKRPDPMSGRLTSAVNYRLLVGTLDHGR